MRAKSFLRLIRPFQWVKNCFVFLPLFFSGQITNLECWYEAIIGFFSFSFAASAIYCMNDIVDADEDRLHPKKRNRPIASGEVTAQCGWIIFLILILLAIGVCFLLNQKTRIRPVLVIIVYIVMNIAYCLKLKQISIVDVVVISLGFVLRIIMGGTVTSIWISPWIVLLTFLLAMFLAIAKRRDDVLLLIKDGIMRRRNIKQYNLEFLNLSLSILGSITIVSYIMYCVSPEVISRLGSEYLYITSIFVLTGILRYLQLALVNERSGSPTKILLHDRFIQLTILLWMLTFVVILYL